MLVIFLLREVSERYMRVIVKFAVTKVERHDRQGVLKVLVVAKAGSLENVAEFLLMNDRRTNFELFICHK